MNSFRVTKSLESIRKRKIEGSDAEDFDASRQTKRPTSQHVGAAGVTQQRKIPTYLPAFSQPLTPVDSSDDESMDCDGNNWRYGRAPVSTSGRLSSCSLSSVLANFDDDEDMDMITSPVVSSTMMPPASAFHSYQTPSRRAMPGLSCTPSPSPESRLPTPIAPNFQSPDFRVYGAQSSHQRGKYHNRLSPVLNEDPTGLLSPLKSPDNNTTSGIDLGMYDTFSRGLGRQGRTAKLYVGFLSDCQKCIQKVPGHSSHVLWS